MSSNLILQNGRWLLCLQSPCFVHARAEGHAWKNGGAKMRLVMFGQLKIGAENQFKMENGSSSDQTKLSVYNRDEGWNRFKLMHRKAQSEKRENERHHCPPQERGLGSADRMMLCTFYAPGKDLSAFFTTWNVDEKSSTPVRARKFTKAGSPLGAKDIDKS